MSYTISARGKNEQQPLSEFVRLFPVPMSEIDSVFGFVEYCKLYGGRPYVSREISDNDVNWLYANNIGLRIPLQNSVASTKDYNDVFEFLSKYNIVGNSVIVTKNTMVEHIRKNFPNYHIEASVIKNINRVEKIIAALKIYDTVVVDPWWFNNTAHNIPTEIRHRIRLFANAGCMYTCPQRICYNSVSKMNLKASSVYRCSAREGVQREYKGSLYEFDVESYKQQGYSKFKLLRSNGMTGY